MVLRISLCGHAQIVHVTVCGHHVGLFVARPVNNHQHRNGSGTFEAYSWNSVASCGAVLCCEVSSWFLN